MAIRVDARTDNSVIFGLMNEYYPRVVAYTAVAAHRGIQTLHTEFGNLNDIIPPENLTKSWKPQLDGIATHEMSFRLHEIPMQTIKVGSEGDKEADESKDGVAAPSVKGSFGLEHYPTTWGVSDVIEGTTPASKNRPGASSVLGVSLEGGIMPTPKDVHYMMKLVAPITPFEATSNGISLDTSHEDNIDRICSVLGITPNELTQVTMDRPVNRPFIEAAKKMGVQLDLIDVGDFMPGVRSAMDVRKLGMDRPMILAGRGGVEEGTTAAVAARTQGTFMEARFQDKNDKEMSKSPILTLAGDLVPGPVDASLLAVAFITDDEKTFGRLGVRQLAADSYLVGTMVVSHKGVDFRRILINE